MCGVIRRFKVKSANAELLRNMCLLQEQEANKIKLAPSLLSG